MTASIVSCAIRPRRNSFVHALVALLTVGGTSVAQAQVGHMPTRSPYEDQKIGQTLSINAGRLFVARDPAKVAPEPSMLYALRYDIGIGGPSAAYVRYSISPSERRVLAPTQPAATRYTGNTSVTTHIGEVGLDIVLTGRKSWNKLMPSVTASVGMLSDFKDADGGGYRFGGKFDVSWGLALRYVPGGRLSYRLDATNHYWQYSYPDAYFVPASDQTSILTSTRQRNAWKNNWGLTFGAAWLLFR